MELQGLLETSAVLHRHLCPRQVLGVRMGMYAAELLNLDLPQTDKRLLALVETDGCFADGVVTATGCTLGHRTMRLVDFGKVASTFVDTCTGETVRIAPRLDVRQVARQYAPDTRSRWHAQLEGYQIMPVDTLFIARPVVLNFSIEKLISRPGYRTECEACGEEIINEREVVHEGSSLCRACAGLSYYRYTGDSAISIT